VTRNENKSLSVQNNTETGLTKRFCKIENKIVCGRRIIANFLRKCLF